MNLLVVYPYFVDTGAAGHSLMYETLEGLAAAGYAITVVTGESGYMEGGKKPPARPWYRRIVHREQLGAIQVVRTLSWHGHQRGLLGRFLSYAFLSLLNPLAVLLAPKADVALLSPPPLYPIFTSMLACRLRGIPVVTEVRDIWPGSIVQMGLLRNKQLIAITAWMERVVYDRSRAIVALTQGIRDDIVGRGWPAARVHTLPCAVDSARLAPDPGAREVMRSRQGWGDRFVVLYFGALGEANNLGVTLRAAQRLAHERQVLFVLVGDGFRREWLLDQVRALQLPNVQVLPAAPKSEAAAFYNAADACLVTLQDIPVFAGAIPTKLVEGMACGRPVLCGVRGEAQRIVQEAGGGWWFEPDDDGELASLVLRLRADSAAAAGLGARGRAHVVSHFDSAARQRQMAALLAEASARA